MDRTLSVLYFMKVKKRGPFRVVGSREVYRNPWIRVREDRVIKLDGKKGIFGIVEALPGISVVALDRRGNCYLTREYHYGVNKTTLEVMSGGMDKGESPLQAAKREMCEESGLTSRRWQHLGIFYPFTTVLSSKQYVFLARDVERTADISAEDRPYIKIVKMPFRRAVTAVLKNKITHAGSAIAILKADYFLCKSS